MELREPTARISVSCQAGPQAVYDLLSDLSSHLDWAGGRQSPAFRLRSLEAPSGRASQGVRFASTGTIPLSVRSWADSSTVTVADPFRAFGFVTEARAGGEKGMSATYRHLYEIAAEGSGSRITYTLTQLAIARPMLRVALPGVREMTWSLAIPMFAGRGVRNLAALAEERSGTRSGTEVMAPPRAL